MTMKMKVFLSEVTAPTFVTDGDEDDYYCPRFRMRNPLPPPFFCEIHSITATAILTLLW